MSHEVSDIHPEGGHQLTSDSMLFHIFKWQGEEYLRSIK